MEKIPVSLADDIRAVKDAPAAKKVARKQIIKKRSIGKAISKGDFTDRQFAHALIRHSMNAKAEKVPAPSMNTPR